jgi:hypothetical protein
MTTVMLNKCSQLSNALQPSIAFARENVRLKQYLYLRYVRWASGSSRVCDTQAARSIMATTRSIAVMGTGQGVLHASCDFFWVLNDHH